MQISPILHLMDFPLLVDIFPLAKALSGSPKIYWRESVQYVIIIPFLIAQYNESSKA